MTLKMTKMLNFPSLYEKLNKEQLSIKTAYKLVLIIRAIDTELAFYREKFNEIIQECGLRDDEGNLVPTEDGQGIKLLPGKELECQTKMIELNQLDFTIPDFSLSLDELEGVHLSLEEMEMLLPFVQE